MTRKAFVSGVDMTPFTKPGANEPYFVMGADAARAALADAGVDYSQIQQAYVGYVYGDSTCGQKTLYQIGMTGIPVFNVNNNCSTGSTALFLARQAIEGGAADCVLVLGFEQMERGAIGAKFQDRPTPFENFDNLTEQLIGHAEIPLAIRYFGGAGLYHMKKYGTRVETFAKIRAKASHHAVHNQSAIFRQKLTEEDVLASPLVMPSVHRLMVCPPTCGAAAAVLCSEEFAHKHKLDASVFIAAQAMTTDPPETFESKDMIDLVGYQMAKRAANQVYEQAGIAPADVDVVELHDCFAQNELISYEALGLAAEGEGEKLVWDNDNTYGGKFVTNPSGGLLSKGHPLGATGLAQCTELVQQLRGRGGARQVENARLALQHNLGLGGACVVTLYATN
jgi:acetyl-CoA acetyltransferase